MSTWTNMPFGATGSFLSVDITWSFNPLEITFGTDKTEYFLSRGYQLQTTSEFCNATGIAKNAGTLGGSGKISSVSLTAAEVMPDPTMTPFDPGADLSNDNGPLLKAVESCFTYLAIDYQYSIAGQGVPPYDETAQGTQPGAKTFNTATGTFSIVTQETAVLKQITQSKPQDNTWGWTMDLGVQIGAVTPGSTHLLTAPTEFSDLIPANIKGRYTNTQTMNGDDAPSKAQEQWSFEGWQVS